LPLFSFFIVFFLSGCGFLSSETTNRSKILHDRLYISESFTTMRYINRLFTYLLLLTTNVVPLVFAVKPDIADHDIDSDVIVAKGRRLTLTCRVITGSPSPSITWYINGSPAADAPRAPVIDPAARTLVFRSATHADSGRYTCVAANTAGSDVTHFDVHVIGLFVSRDKSNKHSDFLYCILFFLFFDVRLSHH